MRMDDNGNTAVMAYFETLEAAQQAALEYEARVHKQTYWVEKVE